MIDSRKQFDSESSSEVHKMLGCLNCKYPNCSFIRRCFQSTPGTLLFKQIPVPAFSEIVLRGLIVSKQISLCSEGIRVSWQYITNCEIGIMPSFIVTFFVG